MQKKIRITRALIFLPTALIAWFAPVLHASSLSEPGINVTVYNNFGYNGSPPLPEVSGRPIVGTTEVQTINQNFDQSPIFGMYEDFIVKYEGHITSPVTGNITFWPQADDGTMFYLDGVLIDQGNWRDKGGGGFQSGPQEFVGGISKPFTYWYYENGGGANTALYWNIGNGWEIVPASAFTKAAVNTPVTTTTTLAPYFNPVTNLIAVAKPDGGVDLGWNIPEPSNLEIYAYTVSFFKLEDGVESGGWGVWTEQPLYNLGPWMWTGTTGYGEVRFKIRPGTVACFAPSNLECFYGPEQYVDVLLIDPTPTTTTTLPIVPPQTTEPVQSTLPPETTTSTSTTLLPSTTIALPPATTTSSITPVPSTTLTPSTTTTSVPANNAELLLVAKTVEEILQVVDSILSDGVSDDEAKGISTNEEALKAITQEQALKVFEALDIDSLTLEESEKLIEAIQGAPEEIRETFEDSVNIFGGATDSYVPVDSKISVGERRIVVAASAVLSISYAVSSVPTISSQSSSSGSASDRRKLSK